MKASDRVYETLLREIQSGALQPGTVIAEVEQAQRFGVSRTPTRTAIERLVSDRLLVQQSPRVTLVTSLDAADIQQLFVARRVLEEQCARLAALSPQREQFHRFAETFTATTADTAAAVDHYYATIAQFDTAVDAAVANEYLTAALTPIRQHLVRARSVSRDNHTRLTASAAEHALIASAIAAGDADLAAHATHVHLHNALTSILTALHEGA